MELSKKWLEENGQVIGKNVYHVSSGSIHGVFYDDSVKPLKVTEKGNKTIATVGGRVFIGKGCLNFTYYELGA